MSTSGSTVRDAVLELLRALDMRTLFGNPGSTELPLYRDFPSDFRYVLGLQESIVVAMADGYAQSRGRAAFVNLHSAIGVGHAMGSIFTAFRNQTPLVITAGQQARAILPTEPFLYSEQPTLLARPYVKWSSEPARAEDVPAAIERAYHTALQAPCGPTLVSIPVDDWDRPAPLLTPRAVSRRQGGDPELLARAAGLLACARRPVLVVGPELARDGAWDAAIALVERHRMPVWVSPMSARCSFPEDHPLFAGFLPAQRAGLVARLAGADLVLVLGAPVFTWHIEGQGPMVPPGAQLVQLTNDPSAAARAAGGLSIVTDLKLGVAALLAASAPTREAPVIPPRPASPAAHPLTDAWLCHRIAALRPRDSIIVEEAPSTRPRMHAQLPMLCADGFFTCASGGLGHGLPAAVGVALAHPQRKVIALLGDGSALYAIQGLWSAVEEDVPVTFVIVSNGGYRALEDFAPQFGLSEIPGTHIAHLDFATIARAQGMQARRVDSAAELDAALTAAFAARAPNLIEVCVR